MVRPPNTTILCGTLRTPDMCLSPVLLFVTVPSTCSQSLGTHTRLNFDCVASLVSFRRSGCHPTRLTCRDRATDCLTMHVLQLPLTAAAAAFPVIPQVTVPLQSWVCVAVCCSNNRGRDTPATSPHMPYWPLGHVKAQPLLTLYLPAAQQIHSRISSHSSAVAQLFKAHWLVQP